MDKIEATVIGHSYVARLHRQFENGTFVPRGPEGLFYNFVGVGGARVCPPGGYKSLFRQVSEVKRRQPDIIFLHIGENDIGVEGVETCDIVEQIIRLVEMMIRECKPRVMLIGQLTEFPAHSRYGHVAKEVTRRLLQYVTSRNHRFENTKLKAWLHDIKINGVNGGRFFDRDDIHLNPQGLRNYYKSVMAAVGRYARVIIEERRWQH